MIGIVLVAVILYCLLQLGIGFNAYLSRFENSLELALVCFGALGLVGIMALILLFNRSLLGAKKHKPKTPPDLKIVALEYIEAFICGLK